MEKRQMEPKDMQEMQRLLELYSKTGDVKYLVKAKKLGKDRDRKTFEGYMFK
jgi:tRNA A37 N6-isopentenylltransferase MiaA